MKTHDTKSSLRKKYIRASAMAAAASMAMNANAAELVVNGGFDHILENWGVEDALGSWIPYEHPGGTISCSPDTMNYTGPLISQTLNIEGIANQTVSASLDLGCEWAVADGHSIALNLEYLDSGGNRQQVEIINPDNATVPEGSMAMYSTLYTFPADASRLVGISLNRKEDVWGIRADNISLDSTGLTAGPLPHLQKLSPDSIVYGGLLTIKGRNFGSETGSVKIGGTTNGVATQSWNQDTVEVLVSDACLGGNVEVETQGCRTIEKRNLLISSPHFMVEVSPEMTIATPGQLIEVAAHAVFKSGFTTADGIGFSVPEAPLADFAPNAVYREGGSLLTLDTTGLSPGIHTFTLTATESNSPQRTATFRVDVREVASITCAVDGTSLDGITFSNQTPAMASYSITDTLGNDITYLIPKMTWSSDNPTDIDIFEDSSPWGSLYLLPHKTGSAQIKATLPGGENQTFTANATIADHPSIQTHHCTASVMSNGPAETNELFCLASASMTYYSFSVSDLGWVSQDSYWNGDNSSHTYEFTLTENQKPGTFMLRSSVTVAGVSLSDGCLLRVVNDPATGMIKGHVAQFGGDMMGHGASGFMEFYDAATGALSFTRNIWDYSANYTVPSLPPGNYKVRFIPDNMDIPPQWYPNATTNTQATVITVAAGNTVTDINFTLSPPDVPMVYPAIVEMPSYDPASGTLSFAVETEANSNYTLQKSATLKEGSWFNLDTFWGDGSNALLQDTDTASPAGFYRVVPQ
ncbi:IPT/TIG domain-containing protein [Pontiellaceae bacterium B12227]|nr:IPT/TIG domain-containing protein [Pontiellaceae bacterium B12227]